MTGFMYRHHTRLLLVLVTALTIASLVGKGAGPGEGFRHPGP